MGDVRALERNLRVLRFMQLAAGMQLFVPVFFLFLRSNGLGWQEVFVIEAVFIFAGMAFQIPVGAIVDRVGRKPVLVGGFLAGAAGFAVYGSTGTLPWFVVAEILLAFYVTCHVIGLEAMTHATLAGVGREHEYRRTMGELQCNSMWTMAVASVLGGLAACWSLRLTVWLSVPAMVACAAFALRLTEPGAREVHSLSLLRVWKDALFGRPALRAVVLVNAAFATSTMALAWFTQPYQAAMGTPFWVIGGVGATALLLSALVSRFVPYLERFVDDRLLLLTILVTVTGCLAGMALTGGVIGIVLLLVGRACFGALVVGNDLLHKLVEPGTRGRVIAVQGCLTRAVMGGGCFGFGTLLEGQGLTAALWTIAGFASVMMTGSFLLLLRHWAPLPETIEDVVVEVEMETQH